MQYGRKIGRREFLKFGTTGVLASVSIGPAFASELAASQPRSLALYNLHTDERLQATYWSGGRYVPESLNAINHILRDHRTGELHEIAQHLLDTLWRLSVKLEITKPFEIISGFRSPATNAKLRNEGHNVAEHSLHMDGLAADIRAPGIQLKTLRAGALSLKAGGVGYYPDDGFVHVDVGRVRYW